MLRGIGTSKGIGIGKALIIHKNRPESVITFSENFSDRLR